MSKIMNTTLATAAALAALAMAVPTASMAQQANGITNCDAPGGRQQAGAVIGGVIGALAGSQISSNERALGAVAGAGAGAAAGSYIGCNQQRARSESATSGGAYRATSNLRIRSGPGTNYRQVGMLSAGQPFSATGSQGEWVQIAGGGWVSARYVTAN
ncbi:MAG: SH3 domain-containing protein [Alphaproteobacteria bacterium]|nr:SH3 domain-containing protein [Alphaproteobacteria bacterium]MBU2126031.1 SH3 domain-containing protein [Alphaproteobacteria bacterium]MBU2209257.1 SH3 domain-containing protein [Alphaproteobacteria bacterium]MBU2290417.1 SH3 domain-containing protein [Alphaproteobacteria bacterium]MBU2396196.1 SH3 domain-containing protein [Alphaproteobacteria bacterium]